MQGDSATARRVVVEIYVLRAVADGRLAYRRLTGALGRAEDPDSAARRLAGVGETVPLVHSTSWRCAADGGVVLTYAVAPDPEPARPATPLGPSAQVARGERADRPAPDAVGPDQVAAHAARHLAFLAEHDDVARAALTGDPLLAEAVARHAPGMAGRL
ncbi:MULTISPECIES: hypothetical protein [Thermomonosporaceae]|uniref:hypothetical protein n=1 Tax=Thermomonosporaceae TaxID=2012 RepID=UPI00255ACE22|nr:MULTISPECIES: hypothetical protein [Thermomonosporaceae]MDL4772744.1 hypothetical protein [Actinomadura xylanilytica]